MECFEFAHSHAESASPSGCMPGQPGTLLLEVIFSIFDSHLNGFEFANNSGVQAKISRALAVTSHCTLTCCGYFISVYAETIQLRESVR